MMMSEDLWHIDTETPAGLFALHKMYIHFFFRHLNAQFPLKKNGQLQAYRKKKRVNVLKNAKL